MEPLERRGRALAHIILAAGRGTRLSDSTHLGPKWLLPVGGQRIADYQLDGIAAAAAAHDCLIVVTGFDATAITDALASRNMEQRITCVHNDAWRERNNWYSLLLGLQHLDELGWDGGIVVVNSDLCAAAAMFAEFVTMARDESTDKPTLAIDFDRAVTDESMKVGGERRADGIFRCMRIGKVGISRPAGEYIGLAAFPPGSWRTLSEYLRRFSAPEHHDEWYEAAFAQMMGVSGGFDSWAVPSGAWVEVDDDADWRRAAEVMTA